MNSAYPVIHKGQRSAVGQKPRSSVFWENVCNCVTTEFKALLLHLCKFLVQIHLTRHLKAYLSNYSWFGPIDVDFQKMCETCAVLQKPQFMVWIRVEDSRWWCWGQTSCICFFNHWNVIVTNVTNFVFNMKIALRGLLVKKCRYKLIKRVLLVKKLIIR